MLSEIEVTGKKDTRSGFGDGILEAAQANENIVALTADLAGSLKLGGFIKAFPERFIQCGIAESQYDRNCCWTYHWRQNTLYDYFCKF